MPKKQISVQNDDLEVGANKPPYVAYKTFRNFIETLKVNGVPNSIDRSVMPSMSGTNRTLILHALRYLNLIDNNGATQKQLNAFVYSEGEERKKILCDILQISYPFLFDKDFIKNATQNTYHNKFVGFDTTGSTIQKSEIFFLQAAKDAEIEVSSYIKPTKPSKSDATRKSARPKQSKVEGIPNENEIGGKKELPDQRNNGLDNKIVEKILDKFPQFNPEWSKEAQEDWLRAINEFYKTLKQ